MVLPPGMAQILQSIRGDYTQTCSKTEQLTLALFMEAGHYQTNIKKMRKLYAQKLHTITRCLTTEKTKVTNTSSGLTIIVHIQSNKTADELCSAAAAVGIKAVPALVNSDEAYAHLILYYSRIPLEEIPVAVEKLLDKWYL